MPLQATSGAASYDAFGGGVAAVPKYIEDYFSTYLFSGTGSDQAITNNIDLSTKGGLVWLKKRTYPSGSVTSHYLMDTNRGTSAGYLSSNSTAAENAFDIVSSFNTNGFGFNTPVNDSGDTYVSWSWAKAPKFFDVVTLSYTSGAAVFNHSLGSVPGFVIIKVSTGYSDNWWVYHRSLGNDQYISLNLTSQAQTSTGIFSATDTTFTVKNGIFSASTIVAYLYAHNAGGFGLTGTDNVISCGSFTCDGSGNATVNLGFEPQWIIAKEITTAGYGWQITDNMRGLPATPSQAPGLLANTSAAEVVNVLYDLVPTSTGFNCVAFSASKQVIYIAIRRGPMKVPTDATKVFSPTLVTGNGTNDRQITGVGFPPDLLIGKTRSSVQQPLWYDKLRGKGKWLESNNTLAEQSLGGGNEGLMLQDGFTVDNNYGSLNINTRTYVDWVFRRAPSFFDEVCYTGTGSVQNVSHNLAAVPELMILKQRNGVTNWMVYHSALGNTKAIYLDSTTNASSASAGFWNNTSPTSSVFTVSMVFDINGSGSTSVAYLFATCAGVSKVGSYTGTATTKQIDCGFTGGARFVLIKRTDASGDWYVWDSARGIVAGNDPYLLLNSTAAEVTSTDYIDTYSAGFEISSTAPAAINASGGSFIFFAVA